MGLPAYPTELSPGGWLLICWLTDPAPVPALLPLSYAGAFQLDGAMLHGRTMLNLDTEDWGDVFIGCAGGWRHGRGCLVSSQCGKLGCCIWLGQGHP